MFGVRVFWQTIVETLFRSHDDQSARHIWRKPQRDFSTFLLRYMDARVFLSVGELSYADAWNLVTEMTLDALQKIAFGIDTIRTAEDLSDNYYVPTDDYDTFPATDSISPRGMLLQMLLQYSVAAAHQFAGSKLYKDCARCMTNRSSVVPPHPFEAFSKQRFKATTRTDDVTEIRKLRQYVFNSLSYNRHVEVSSFHLFYRFECSILARNVLKHILVPFAHG